MIVLFALIALITTVSAGAVVFYRNPLHSAIALVLHMLSVAVLYAMLDAHFLAAVQVVVYAGAIMVLVLFLVMLLNIKVERVKPIRKSYLAFGLLAAIGFLSILIPILKSVFLVIPDPVAPLIGGAREIGRVLYSDYLFPFETASVLIFVAIVGAVMVAKRNYSATQGVVLHSSETREDSQ